MGMRARSDATEPARPQPSTSASGESAASKDEQDSDEDEFHDCLSWGEADLEVGLDASASPPPTPSTPPPTVPAKPHSTNSLPKKLKDSANSRMKWLNRQVPPHKIAPDGTSVYYWCDLPQRRASVDGPSLELDDGAYNPLWTMRGFTQTFHFWKENKRAQSVPLNAFLTYVTLPWWSIAKDILDHREDPILTF